MVNHEASPLFENNQVLNNAIVGISFRDQSAATAKNNYIEASPYGIFISENAQPSLMANSFMNVDTEIARGERPY